MKQTIALFVVAVGFSARAHAECASGYTEIPSAVVCQSAAGSNPACASGYGPVSNAFVCQQNAGGTAKIDDTDSSIIYSTKSATTGAPSWLTSTVSPEDYLSTEHFSNFTTSPTFQILGAALVVNFTGTGITWIGKIGPNLGIASYSVDGGTPVTFNAYNAAIVAQNNNVVVSGLASGSHSLKMEVTHNKNASSSDYYQVIDAFNITGSPIPFSQGTVAGYNSPALSFSGPRTCGPASNGEDLSGGHCYSNATNASISWTFTGTLIEIFGRPDTENGIFNVLIDGTQVAQIDGHFGTALFGQPDDDPLNGYPFFESKVAPGTHTIQIVNTGTKDSAATDTFTQIDQFAAFP